MDHKDLDAWKNAMQLAVEIYHITKDFPQEERYGLTSQLRRAGVSIPTNMAEGAAKGSDKDFVRFLHISLGSLAELETLMILSSKLNYCDNNTLIEITDRITGIKKLTHGLIRHIKNKI